LTDANDLSDSLMPAGKPEAEVDISENLVRRLLRDQHPDLSALPITHLSSGWDNVIYRLGREFTVRVPRRQIAAQLLINEQTWLPELAPKLPIAIPAPLRVGSPTDYYPWHWSVLPWLPGEPADLAPPDANQAEVFAEFLLCLHQAAPSNAPANPVRGIPLRVRAPNTEERLERLRSRTDAITAAIERLWTRGLNAADSKDLRWLHGDIHSQNVLVANGEISAIIDWGDITSGDAATDLAGIWVLFDEASARRTVLERYAPDQATFDRARGWAMMFATVLLDSGLINSPRHSVMGRDTFRRLVEDS
jgi:aminoglycoside phosphotransferase (APT) family kinase protein